jgi:hypothetical protein
VSDLTEVPGDDGGLDGTLDAGDASSAGDARDAGVGDTARHLALKCPVGYDNRID